MLPSEEVRRDPLGNGRVLTDVEDPTHHRLLERRSLAGTWCGRRRQRPVALPVATRVTCGVNATPDALLR